MSERLRGSKYFRDILLQDVIEQHSLAGPQKTLEEASEFLRSQLPDGSGENTKYRVLYAIHRIRDDKANGIFDSNSEDFETIGTCTLKPGMTVPIHDHMTTKTNEATGVLRLEIGYQFLPEVWGKGYATEACIALLDACRKSNSHFAPYTSLYIDGVVSPDNPASMKVLEKAGLKQIGLNAWEGEPVFLAGAMRDPVVWVYGIKVF